MSKIRQKPPDFGRFPEWLQGRGVIGSLSETLNITGYVGGEKKSRSRGHGISFALYHGKEKRYATD